MRQDRYYSVRLDPQKEADSCGMGCAQMMLEHLNVTVNENDIINKCREISGTTNNAVNHAMTIASATNYYLELNSKNQRFASLYCGGNLSTYSSNLLSYLSRGYPVIANVARFSSTEYFGYSLPTSGHYIIINGLFYDNQAGNYVLLVTDPHKEHHAIRLIPLNATFMNNYLTTGNQHVICVTN